MTLKLKSVWHTIRRLGESRSNKMLLLRYDFKVFKVVHCGTSYNSLLERNGLNTNRINHYTCMYYIE